MCIQNGPHHAHKCRTPTQTATNGQQMLSPTCRVHDKARHRLPVSSSRTTSMQCSRCTFKNNFVAGLCTTDKTFLLHLWDKLIPQAILMLNLMHGSRINPNLSAWAQVHGNYDFNKTPIVPTEIKVLIHKKPSNRTTWAPMPSKNGM